MRRVTYRSCQACHVPFPSGTSRTVTVRHVTYRSCKACHVSFLSGMSRTVAVRHVVVSAATPPLHIICQTGQMAVVCGVVSVVGRRQAAAVPVGLGEVFYLQWTVRSIVRGIQSVTERKHSAEGIQYTTGRGQSDKKRLFSPERGGKTGKTEV